jgi:hypothetical protein
MWQLLGLEDHVNGTGMDLTINAPRLREMGRINVELQLETWSATITIGDRLREVNA